MGTIPTYQLVLFGLLFLVGALLSSGLVPRNRFFGVGTARTLATDATWCRANRAVGLVTLALAGAAVLLKAFPPHALVQAILGVFVVVGAAGAYAVVYRRYAA